MHACIQAYVFVTSVVDFLTGQSYYHWLRSPVLNDNIYVIQKHQFCYIVPGFFILPIRTNIIEFGWGFFQELPNSKFSPSRVQLRTEKVLALIYTEPAKFPILSFFSFPNARDLSKTAGSRDPTKDLLQIQSFLLNSKEGFPVFITVLQLQPFYSTLCSSLSILYKLNIITSILN